MMCIVNRCNKVFGFPVAISSTIKIVALTVTLLFPMSFVHAVSVSYFLDQSNALSDGVDYLQITINDEGVAGNINFTVKTLDALDSMAQQKYGIDLFAFNSSTKLDKKNISGLPNNWSFDKSGNISEYGLFSYELRTHGTSSLASILDFSITGVGGDVIGDYILSSNRAGKGSKAKYSGKGSKSSYSGKGSKSSYSGKGSKSSYSGKGSKAKYSGRGSKSTYPGDGSKINDEVFFAAHVKGFKTNTGSKIESAFFAGAVKPVPLPAAVWLFGSGLVGLVVVARRRKTIV